MVLIGALAAVAVWFIRRGLPESPRWLAQSGRIAKADAILRALEARVAREYGAPLPAPEAVAPLLAHGRMRDMWIPPYRARTIMMIVFNVLQTVSFYGFGNWVPTFLIQKGIAVTSSLLYTTIIALAAPVGPLVGLLIADRFERKHVLAAAAIAIIVCGLAFGQAADALAIIALGAGLTLANNIMSYTFHAYQQELFPTGIRARCGLRLFLEPLLGDLHRLPYRLRAAAVRRRRRVRVHRRGHADRCRHYRGSGAAHARPGAGAAFALKPTAASEAGRSD